MRYEALFAAAFVAGLLGAMSQQNVAPPVRHVHNTPPAPSAAFNQIVIPIAPAPVPAKAALASAEPTTAKQVAAEAKPVKRVIKVAKKA